MFFPRTSPDYDVVEVNEADEPFKASESCVHHSLEDTRSVLQAKGHTQELVQTAVSNKGRLLARNKAHKDLPEALGAVESRDEFQTFHHGQGVVDSR